MKKNLLLIIVTLINSNLAFADCDFKIINYTNFEISAKVGFYGSIESSIMVKPSDTTFVRMKGDYKCNDSTPFGTGRAYVMFPKNQGSGANYSPLEKGINLMGQFSSSAGGRIIKADNGQQIWLNASGKPIDDTTFEIKLNFTERPNSRSAGTT
ncbi:MAG: hypothetical protein K2X04_06575 [Burkholderiales bacterium]|nr:hypothetical protein [Burkholderiales bacterium]